MEGPIKNLPAILHVHLKVYRGTKAYIWSQGVVAGHRLIQKSIRTSTRVSHRFVDLYLTIIFHYFVLYFFYLVHLHRKSGRKGLKRLVQSLRCFSLSCCFLSPFSVSCTLKTEEENRRNTQSSLHNLNWLKLLSVIHRVTLYIHVKGQFFFFFPILQNLNPLKPHYYFSSQEAENRRSKRTQLLTCKVNPIDGNYWGKSISFEFGDFYIYGICIDFCACVWFL